MSSKLKKPKFVYLVMCNPKNPLVYGVCKTKKYALAYAQNLIDYRRKRAEEKNWEFGFYHYFNIYDSKNDIPYPPPEHRYSKNKKRKESEFDQRELTIFSACLKIKDGFKDYSDDACLIQVVRRPILESFYEKQ